jgi:hypothetical protein
MFRKFSNTESVCVNKNCYRWGLSTSNVSRSKDTRHIVSSVSYNLLVSLRTTRVMQIEIYCGL